MNTAKLTNYHVRIVFSHKPHIDISVITKPVGLAIKGVNSKEI